MPQAKPKPEKRLRYDVTVGEVWKLIEQKYGKKNIPEQRRRTLVRVVPSTQIGWPERIEIEILDMTDE